MSETTTCICEQLGLPQPSKFTQDWEYELPSEFRTADWLDKYISHYSDSIRTDQEKSILMKLMLDMANDFLEASACRLQIKQVLDLLVNNSNIHRELIDHWACEGDTLEDSFTITPLIRSLKF